MTVDEACKAIFLALSKFHTHTHTHTSARAGNLWQLWTVSRGGLESNPAKPSEEISRTLPYDGPYRRQFIDQSTTLHFTNSSFVSTVTATGKRGLFALCFLRKSENLFPFVDQGAKYL